MNYLEGWAPPGAAWEKDNIGLMVGAEEQKIERIFLCLELTRSSLDEAIKQKCNLIITHHPFIFHPLKKINFTKDPKARLLQDLIKNDIAVFSAHTNLDFTRGGVSFTLAEKLGLKNISFLKNEEANQYKLVVFVPADSLRAVSDALFEAGAGEIGNYTNCSYRTEGVGSFFGNEDANPALGKSGKLEFVDEVRLEMLVHQWNLNRAIKAIINSHPYEEPAYDVYPLKNRNANFGFGAIGDLPKAVSKREFLDSVTRKLKCKNLRYSEGKKGKIKRIAVCGGSGADLLPVAIASGADAFVTADVKYHTFEEARGNVLLIDAGHYETEMPVLDVLMSKIKLFLSENNSDAEVIKFKGSTNPVKFYK